MSEIKKFKYIPMFVEHKLDMSFLSEEEMKELEYFKINNKYFIEDFDLENFAKVEDFFPSVVKKLFESVKKAFFKDASASYYKYLKFSLMTLNKHNRLFHYSEWFIDGEECPFSSSKPEHNVLFISSENFYVEFLGKEEELVLVGNSPLHCLCLRGYDNTKRIENNSIVEYSNFDPYTLFGDTFFGVTLFGDSVESIGGIIIRFSASNVKSPKNICSEFFYDKNINMLPSTRTVELSS